MYDSSGSSAIAFSTAGFNPVLHCAIDTFSNLYLILEPPYFMNSDVIPARITAVEGSSSDTNTNTCASMSLEITQSASNRAASPKSTVKFALTFKTVPSIPKLWLTATKVPADFAALISDARSFGFGPANKSINDAFCFTPSAKHC